MLWFMGSQRVGHDWVTELNWTELRLVIAFLPRNKCFLILWQQSPSAVILEHRKIKSVTVSIVYPSICHKVMRPDAMIFVFWMLSFEPTFSLSSFTFTKKLFSSLLSAISVVSSAYLRLLIFLLAILIPAYASSSPVFGMMYSACKLNKQGDNIQPWLSEVRDQEIGVKHSRTFWRRKWQPTPVFLPGKLHGKRNLVGYSPRGPKIWAQLSDFHFTRTFAGD